MTSSPGPTSASSDAASASVAPDVTMIWSRTTRVGCALASNARDDYLVCRYVPAGNVVGEKALP